MPRFSPLEMSTGANCQAVLSVCRKTLRGNKPIAWPCRHASNTSAATRRRVISAPLKSSWRSWPACTQSITGPRDSDGLQSASTGWRSSSPKGYAASAARSHRKISLTRSMSHPKRSRPTGRWREPMSTGSTFAALRMAQSASPWMKSPRRRRSRRSSTFSRLGDRSPSPSRSWLSIWISVSRQPSPAARSTCPIPSSTDITRSTRCCAISTACRRGISRWCTR